VILYEMLTGAALFTGSSSQEILSRQLDDEVIPPSLRRPDRGIPRALDEIVLRALDKDPARRFASASELAAALRTVAQGCELPARIPWLPEPEPARASPETPTRDCGAPRRRRHVRDPLAALRRRVYRRAR